METLMEILFGIWTIGTAALGFYMIYDSFKKPCKAHKFDFERADELRIAATCSRCGIKIDELYPNVKIIKPKQK